MYQKSTTNQDSDYLPDSTCSETEPETELEPTTATCSESDSDVSGYSKNDSSNSSKITLFDLSEDEYIELQETIFELSDEYINTEGLTMSLPEFKDNLIRYVFHIIIDDLIETEIFTYDHYDDIRNICKEFVELFLDSMQIPDYIQHMNTYSSQIILYDREYKNIIQHQIAFLRVQIQPLQKTEEWYRERHSLMTASNIWKALGSVAQQNSYIAEKCMPFVLQSYMRQDGGCNTSSPMHWGHKYEPLTKMVYEHMFSTVVEEFGCIRHTKYPFIGASPDGINVDPTNLRYGRMVEIKNIFNREITGIPSEKYWIQTQIQLETCGLDLCDFVETRFKEYSEDAFYQDTTHEYSGVILYFREMTAGGGQIPQYKYMPFWINREKSTIDAWIHSQKRSRDCSQLELHMVQYWYLDEISCITIERNRKWFEAAITKLLEIKATIDREKVSGFQHRISARNTKLQNTFIQPHVCLVKLDINENPKENQFIKTRQPSVKIHKKNT